MVNKKFMNFLARLESVGTAEDRDAINVIRGQYAKYAMMEAEDQNGQSESLATLVNALKAYCKENASNPDAIRNAIEVAGKSLKEALNVAKANVRESDAAADEQKRADAYKAGMDKAEAHVKKASEDAAATDNSQLAAQQEKNAATEKAREAALGKSKELLAQFRSSMGQDTDAGSISDKDAAVFYKSIMAGKVPDVKMADKLKEAGLEVKDVANKLKAATPEIAKGAATAAAAKIGDAKNAVANKAKRGFRWLRDKILNEALERGDVQTVRHINSMSDSQFKVFCESAGYLR